jgi:hypothetical protein
VKGLKPPGGFQQIDSYPFVLFSWHLQNAYKIIQKSKNSKPNFAVPSVTRPTTFSRYVYTFELQFLLEK